MEVQACVRAQSSHHCAAIYEPAEDSGVLELSLRLNSSGQKPDLLPTGVVSLALPFEILPFFKVQIRSNTTFSRELSTILLIRRNPILFYVSMDFTYISTRVFCL